MRSQPMKSVLVALGGRAVEADMGSAQWAGARIGPGRRKSKCGITISRVWNGGRCRPLVPRLHPIQKEQQGLLMQRAFMLSGLYVLAMTTLVSAYVIVG